jgi:hypothetical protein
MFSCTVHYLNKNMFTLNKFAMLMSTTPKTTIFKLSKFIYLADKKRVALNN